MTVPHLIRSLFVSTMLSFLAPVGIAASLLLSVFAIRYIPDLEIASRIGVQQINGFLSVFGNGNPIWGILVIGVAFSLVGALFDTFALYHHQQFRGLD